MPARKIVFAEFSTEASDKNRQNNAPGVFTELNGFDLGPQMAGNKAITAAGSDLLTYRGFCRAPLQGATGEQETNADFFGDSPVNSQSLVLLYDELVGNYLVWVNNGNGSDMCGEQAGQRGRVLSVGAENWGGNSPVVVGSQQPVPLENVTTNEGQCPVPPTAPFWALATIETQPSDIFITFSTPIGAGNFYILIATDPTLNGGGLLDIPDIYDGANIIGPFGSPCGFPATTILIPAADIDGGAGINWGSPFTWYIQVVMADVYGPCGLIGSALQTVTN